MILMEEIFFSSTFGGETISLAASIATIDKMTKHTMQLRQLESLVSH